MLSHFSGHWMDHLPMQEHDWTLFSWCMEQVHAGNWAVPGMVSFEYGGVKGFWEEFLDPAVLLEQVPLLGELIHNHRR